MVRVGEDSLLLAVISHGTFCRRLSNCVGGGVTVHKDVQSVESSLEELTLKS